MITAFIEKALERAKYKILKDKTYFGEIPGFRGVWASAKTLEECRVELRGILEDWLVIKLVSGERIAGLRVNLPKRREAVTVK